MGFSACDGVGVIRLGQVGGYPPRAGWGLSARGVMGVIRLWRDGSFPPGAGGGALGGWGLSVGG